MTKRLNFGILLRFLALSLALFGTVTRITLSSSAGFAVDIWLYFTIQSNVMVCAYLLIESIGLVNRRFFPGGVLPSPVQGGILLYILITGIVFNTLLVPLMPIRNFDNFIGHINHTFTPILFFIDWLVNQKKGNYKGRHLWLWIIYPVAYLIFGSIEGIVTGHFRYFFMDFIKQPLGTYFLLIAIVIVFFIGVGGLIVLCDRMMARKAERAKKTEPLSV